MIKWNRFDTDCKMNELLSHAGFASQVLFVLYQLSKVDREDHFQRPGFLHITICVFLGYKASNFV